MLVRIVNRWTYKGVTYVPGDLIELSPELYKHVFEVSVAEEIRSKNVIKVFMAVTQNANIAEGGRVKIALREDEDKHYFHLLHTIDGELRRMYYQIPKDPAVREVA